MKKMILVPDSFKGTLSSREICTIMTEAIRRIFPAVEIVALPIADGGEGCVDTFLAAVGGEKRFVPCKNPYLEDSTGFYGALPDQVAIVEMAAAAGLPLVYGRKNPEKTSTYGVGQLIRAAIDDGASSVIVGLGGSATNDGGVGAAAALGVRFYDKTGETFLPTGGTLHRIARIDTSHCQFHGVRFTAMCDIDNPLCGLHGAAAVFGPQKGADAAMVRRLDDNLAHLAAVVQRDLGVSLLDLPGAGAAGGMGGGMVAFFGSELKMGIEAVLDLVDFDRQLIGADLVFTGEGKLDAQSLRGKAVIGVARRAKAAGVPVIAIVGNIGDGVDAAYEEGISGIFSINRVAVPVGEARGRSPSDLRLTMENLLRFLKRMG
ncbi:MAG: glycerate kinase, partial [Oscillospiraceae bacterium]